jgi:hypothetical protein
MRSRMHTRSRERLVDRLVEAYVDWRETCGWVNDAYRCWTSEEVIDRELVRSRVPPYTTQGRPVGPGRGAVVYWILLTVVASHD